MSYHIIQPIRITSRFCKLSFLVYLFIYFCTFCILYKSKSWRYISCLGKEKLYGTLYIDQNVSQVCQPEFLKSWIVWIFLFKKLGDFSLNRDILKSQENWTPAYFSTLWVSILINRSLLECFWFIVCLMAASWFSSTKQKIFYLVAICGK